MSTPARIMVTNEIVLNGDVTVPREARGLVLFAHGSGSSRHSPRNRFVATELNRAGMATLLMDLLTEDEERAEAQTRHLRFDIGLLAQRLMAATEWVMQQEALNSMPLGYFGASTGAAAALLAAAHSPHDIAAIVSRGGRPDLASAALRRVRAPTLLIVGGADTAVIRLNQDALAQLQAEKRMAIVPGASHLFEEHGTLERVADLASAWFARHFGSTQAAHAPHPQYA